MLPHPNVRCWAGIPLQELVNEVIASLAGRFAAQAIDVAVDIPSRDVVAADRELLRRAVHGLMLNAIDAMPGGGALLATSAAGPHMIELEIADTGSSMSDQQRQQAFELLPATQRGGTGWGLAVVRRIAEMLGGCVMVANCPEGGVAFTLQVPRPVALEAAA